MLILLSKLKALKNIFDLQKHLKSERGNVMIIVVGTMLVLGLIAVAVVAYVYSNQNLIVNERRETKSFHSADAGFNKALWMLDQVKRTYGSVSSTDMSKIIASFDTNPSPSSPGIDLVATVDTEQGVYTYRAKVTQGNTAYGWGVESTGFGPKGVKEKIIASVDSFSIWDFNFSGSSVNAQGGYVTGNVQIHGPFYARGNFRLTGSTNYFDGPLYVKTEPAIPGEIGAGFNDTLSGDIDLQGNATLGTVGTPVKLYVDSECPDCTDAAHCYCEVTYGPGILDIPLPVLNADTMKGMYLAADFLWDPPKYSSSDARNVGSMDANQSFAITYGSTPSFDYTFTDRNGDGFPSGTGHFKWDLASNTLTVNGTVFIDGSINISGGNGQTIKYNGKGTMYANGDVNFNNERFRAENVADFPVVSALGIVTTGTITFTGNNCPACNGSDPAYQIAAFGTTGVRVLKQTHIKGTLISGALSFAQVPDLYTEMDLSANLPPSLPGASEELITQILGWHEVPVR